ncbi:MAG: ATP-binding domain-containing protein, partial [Campylobacteraceae bacterium]|nr:ATP-binding domain-containing protein [Campylobacteraceae bacterium]
TLLPDDIAIMFPDDSKDMYKIFELLEREIKEKLDWEVNKSYETKEKLDKKIFFSNKNNVKGLEFSFVICITIGLDRSLSFRNTLYMMLTRSFLKTYMLLVEDYNKEVLPDIEQALGEILTKGQMTLKEPTDDEKKKIEENIIKYNSKNSTNAVERICDEMDIPTLYRDKIANKIISEIKKRLTEEELRTAVKSCYELLKISQ